MYTLVSKEMRQVMVFRIRDNDSEIATVDDVAIQLPALFYKPTEMRVEFRSSTSDVNGWNGLLSDNVKTTG